MVKFKVGTKVRARHNLSETLKEGDTATVVDNWKDGDGCEYTDVQLESGERANGFFASRFEEVKR